MDIGEAVNVAIIVSLGHENHSEETCAFHSKGEPESKENTFSDEGDMDALEISGLEEAGIAHKNCAAKLGSSLEGKGYSQVSTSVVVPGISPALPVHTAAHHLIPGNASLKESAIMSYLHQEGMAAGNIGYNINNSENGCWLPGNYALRGEHGLAKWGPEGTGFQAKYGQPPKAYAFAAIEATQRQFHDAHGDYSDFVLETLDLLAKKFDKTRDLWCPEAKNQPSDPKKREIMGLVARLNTTSLRMQSMLIGLNWKKNIYTSRFSREFMEERSKGGA